MGAGSATTRNTRGLTREVMRLIVPPLPAVSRPSKTMQIFAPVAGALKEHGAKAVYAYITHPVLSGPAVERITTSALDELVVTDTIPLSEQARACGKIRALSTAELLAETMRRISDEESVSSLYVD